MPYARLRYWRSAEQINLVHPAIAQAAQDHRVDRQFPCFSTERLGGVTTTISLTPPPRANGARQYGRRRGGSAGHQPDALNGTDDLPERTARFVREP
ncbi:hypothetical protein [Candidatus Villigracilis saccharophilus]|uniref:hypothetical protein n=1 Tax=Candidatus Villigracilis saccharophilus TaxID=3140684 RepID=UPI0031E7730E